MPKVSDGSFMMSKRANYMTSSGGVSSIEVSQENDHVTLE